MFDGFLQRTRGRLHYFFSLPGFKKQPLATIARAFQWRILCGLGIPGKITVPAWNHAKLILPPEWHGAGATLFYVVRERYEPELTFLDQFLKPGETFVDAGANCGVFTVAAASIVGKTGKVLAFEPGEFVYKTLKQNVDINGFDQVQLFPVGLSDTTGNAKLYAHPHGASSFSLGCQEGEGSQSFTIALDRLDAVLERTKTEVVHCIKMDVEGAEELILKGAQRLFERCKPRVIFEVNPKAIQALGLKKDGAWTFLKERGYRFFSIDTEGTTSEVAECPEFGGNFIALPRN